MGCPPQPLIGSSSPSYPVTIASSRPYLEDAFSLLRKITFVAL